MDQEHAAYAEGPWERNWTEERGGGMQDLRYEKMAKKYGVHPNDHFHWRVVVTFESGLQHQDDWHAQIEDAQRIVTETARITHDREKGNRGCVKSIECSPLGMDGNIFPEVK